MCDMMICVIHESVQNNLKMKRNLFFHDTVHFFFVQCNIQEYFIYTSAVSIIARGKWALPGETKTIHRLLQAKAVREETRMNWAYNYTAVSLHIIDMKLSSSQLMETYRSVFLKAKLERNLFQMHSYKTYLCSYVIKHKLGRAEESKKLENQEGQARMHKM